MYALCVLVTSFVEGQRQIAFNCEAVYMTLQYS